MRPPPHLDSRRRRPLLGLAVGLCLSPGLFAQGAETSGNMFAGGRNAKGEIWAERSLADKMDGLGYPRRSPDRETLTQVVLPWEGGPKLRVPEDLEEGFETLRYNRMLESYFRPDPESRRRPAHDFQRSLMGVTGMLTMPNSYVLPPGVWSAGFAYWHEDAGPEHWPALYRSQDNDHLKLFVNRGFHNHLEAGLILHYTDADIVYPNQGANPNTLRFRDDFVLGGINAKAAIPFYDLWVSAGFTYERIDDEDRSFLDLRSYDHMSSLFLTISDSGKRWDGTVGMRVTKVATDGRGPPVGGASIQPGFSTQPTWTQLGLGFEYGKWGGLSLILEAQSRHRVDLLGISEQEVNYGVKYETSDLVLKAFSLRQNQSDTDNYGLSLSARF